MSASAENLSRKSIVPALLLCVFVSVLTATVACRPCLKFDFHETHAAPTQHAPLFVLAFSCRKQIIIFFFFSERLTSSFFAQQPNHYFVLKLFLFCVIPSSHSLFLSLFLEKTGVFGWPCVVRGAATLALQQLPARTSLNTHVAQPYVHPNLRSTLDFRLGGQSLRPLLARFGRGCARQD